MVFVPYMAHTSSNVAYRTFDSHIYVLNIMILDSICQQIQTWNTFKRFFFSMSLLGKVPKSNTALLTFSCLYPHTFCRGKPNISVFSHTIPTLWLLTLIRHAVTFHLFQLPTWSQLIYTRFHICQPPRFHSPFTCHIASTLIGVHIISPSTEGWLHHFQVQTCLQTASSQMFFFFFCEPRILRFIFIFQIVWKCTYILTERVFVSCHMFIHGEYLTQRMICFGFICSALTIWQLYMPVNSFFSQHKF